MAVRLPKTPEIESAPDWLVTSMPDVLDVFVFVIVTSIPCFFAFDSTRIAEPVPLALFREKKPAEPFPFAKPAIAAPVPLFSPMSAC